MLTGALVQKQALQTLAKVLVWFLHEVPWRYSNMFLSLTRISQLHLLVATHQSLEIRVIMQRLVHKLILALWIEKHYARQQTQTIVRNQLLWQQLRDWLFALARFSDLDHIKKPIRDLLLCSNMTKELFDWFSHE